MLPISFCVRERSSCAPLRVEKKERAFLPAFACAIGSRELLLDDVFSVGVFVLA